MDLNEGKYLLIVLLLAFLWRIPSFPLNTIGIDESMYFTIAQDINTGGSIYNTLFEPKGPLLFLIFTPIIKIFGTNIYAIRVYTTLYILASMIIIYLISRHLFENTTARIVSPLTYGYFFSIEYYRGLSSNAEIFMMLPAIISIYLYMKSRSNSPRKTFLYITSGFFTGLTFFIKISGFFTVIIIPLAIIALALRDREDIKDLINQLSQYTTGIILAFIPIIAFLIQQKSITGYVYALRFGYNYVMIIPLKTAIIKLCNFFIDQVLNFEIITILFITSVAYTMTRIKKLEGKERDNIIFIYLMIVSSFIGVFLGRYMFPHYYLQMSLPFSLLIAFTINHIIPYSKNKLLNQIVLIFLTFLLILAAIKIIDEYPVNYRESMDQDEILVAYYLNKNTHEKDRIYVLGGEPVIYFLSERKSPTKYFIWFFHDWKNNMFFDFKEESMNAFKKETPKYIIYNQEQRYYQKMIFIEKFMFENYTLESRIGNYSIYKIKT